MKNKIFAGVVLAFIGISAININFVIKGDELQSLGLGIESVEALASETGSDGRIYCRCTEAWLASKRSCASNGKNAKCAQSSPGGNIDCSQYNANCQ